MKHLNRGLVALTLLIITACGATPGSSNGDLEETVGTTHEALSTTSALDDPSNSVTNTSSDPSARDTHRRNHDAAFTACILDCCGKQDACDATDRGCDVIFQICWSDCFVTYPALDEITE
jgi:hypothetical protein